MKLVLAATLIVLVLMLYYAYPIVHAKRISKGIQASAIPYEQHPKGAALHILIAGDSTGVGTGAVPSSTSIAGRIGADFPNADITNISHNGLKLAGLRDTLAALPSHTYDLIVFQIGANDVTGFTSKSDESRDIAVILAYASEHARSTILLTSGNVGAAPIFRPPLTTLFSARTREIHAIFIAAVNAQHSVRYVDLYTDISDDVLRTNVPLYYANDHFHPSGAGYGVWYEKVGPAVHAALLPSSSSV